MTEEMDKRRLRKFLARSEPPVAEEIVEMRSSESGQIPIMTLTHTRTPDGFTTSGIFAPPTLPKRTLDGIIVQCRVFFHVREDCYLPSVVKSLRRLHNDVERSRARQGLGDLINKYVQDGRLVNPDGGAVMYSGRLESDNGLGPNRLLGSDQVAMDYINGVAFHEGEDAITRLQNVEESSVSTAVIFELDKLLRIVENVRAQILHDIEVGHISVDA
jgi:hypothetical protein